MRYPEKLNKGDIIGVTAPSLGITNQRDSLRVDNAIKNLEQKGFHIKETANIRTCENSRSSSGKQRAKEFLELWNDEDVKSIICLEGGDFAIEMLDNLDLNSLQMAHPKWIQGYSDITNLGYVFTLNLDIATIYGPNFKSFGMRNLHTSHENSLKLMAKEEFVQNSYEKHEIFSGWDDENTSTDEQLLNENELKDDVSLNEEKLNEKDPYEEFDLTAPVKWINLNGEEKIEFSGRCIGGCLDCIKDLMGTKYDKVSEYIEKYKNDGIVWFVESFETSTPGLFRTLWQMKNAGYFKNCNGIIFGRPLMVREDFGYSYQTAIKDALKELNIPIIIDADIGHLAPQIPIVNGAILEVKSEAGIGSIKNIFI